MTYMYHDSREDSSPAASGFEKLLGELQPGDCMVVEQLSGAAKDEASLLKLLEDLEARGIRFRSVEEDFDTGTEQGRSSVENEINFESIVKIVLTAAVKSICFSESPQ